jgi:dipeptidyl-peptidase-4
MTNVTCSRPWIAAIVLVILLLPTTASSQGSQADYERSAALRDKTKNKVVGGSVKPHWLPDGRGLWYVRDLKDGHQFILADAQKGARRPAFDHAAVARALTSELPGEFTASTLPFRDLTIDKDGGVHFNAGGHGWTYQDGTLTQGQPITIPKPAGQPSRRQSRGSRQGATSPDGSWKVVIQDHNVVLQLADSEEQTVLTKDGTEKEFFTSSVFWSPDSEKFVVMRQRPAEKHPVSMVESSPQKQLQPKIFTFDYLKPGDQIAQSKPHLFHVADKREIPLADDLYQNPWQIQELRWQADSSRFTFLYNQRGHQVLRICGVDAASGDVSAVINEVSDTFIDYAYKKYSYYLDESQEIIWMSERDGWNHLYLYDSAKGQVTRQITSGPWVVRGVDRVDPESGTIWFRASGIDPAQDPYYIHYCKIQLDGSRLVRLTRGDGTHSIQYSPDRTLLVDTYSRVDMPPVSELHRADDGRLVCKLESADWSALLATGWQVPERFVARARDGATDIHGVIYRPTTFDPRKSYPVIEKIYAGPHGSFVPKRFSAYHSAQAIAELGFITVQIDGLGTSNRSKAFHDVCWKNLGDSGFPDRILWLQAAARKHRFMDLTRVGIYGGSAGGQSALRAMLAHPGSYHVAVADCGCHDNRMDKIWWNELWMSWPIGPHYAEQSNVTQAHKLQGKLLLTVGELDRNVDPASTMQVVNALIKADRDFEMIVFPGGGHGIGESPYGQRRRKDFFVRHLLEQEPRWTAEATGGREKPGRGRKPRSG